MRRLAAGMAAAALLVVLMGTGPSVAAGPKAYVGLFKDDAVAVIDTTQNRVVATIPVPKGPHGLVLTPDGRKAYVSSDGASTVSVIDTASDRIVASIDVGPNPHGLAMSSRRARSWAASFTGLPPPPTWPSAATTGRPCTSPAGTTWARST